jgi:hypothetical protein
MSDFWKTIAATFIGAVIAFFGTWYSATHTAAKEYKAEMRGKLEQLMAGVVRSNKCFDTLVLSGTEPKDCEEQEPLWKSITLTELYFQNIIPEMTEFQQELLDAKVALLVCEPDLRKPSQKNKENRDICANKVYEKFNPSGRLEKIFKKAKEELPRLSQ